MTEKKGEIGKLSFEEALAELEGIVKLLEGGSVKLDDALATYERGVKLRNFCQKKLDEARLRIEKVAVNGRTGEPEGVEPLDGEGVKDEAP